MRGIAGRRPKAATINLEEVKSARSITAGNEEPSDEETHLSNVKTQRRRDASPSRRLYSTSTSRGLA
jgi:hypothetical protein